jgi:hypothetical protein
MSLALAGGGAVGTSVAAAHWCGSTVWCGALEVVPVGVWALTLDVLVLLPVRVWCEAMGSVCTFHSLHPPRPHGWSTPRHPANNRRDWTFSQVALPMSIVFVTQGLVAASFGKWQMSVGPRAAIAVSSLCFGGGMALGALGLATSNIGLLYAGGRGPWAWAWAVGRGRGPWAWAWAVWVLRASLGAGMAAVPRPQPHGSGPQG